MRMPATRIPAPSKKCMSVITFPGMSPGNPAIGMASPENERPSRAVRLEVRRATAPQSRRRILRPSHLTTAGRKTLSPGPVADPAHQILHPEPLLSRVDLVALDSP